MAILDSQLIYLTIKFPLRHLYFFFPFFQKKKVFICHGPYPIVRAVLRKRGWVEKHYKGNLLPSKNKKNDSDGSDDDSCDSGDDSDNENSAVNHSPRSKEKNTKPSSNAKTRTINVSKNKGDDDDDDSDCDDSDDESDDNEDWNAGYEGNGPDCEFSLMVSKHFQHNFEIFIIIAWFQNIFIPKPSGQHLRIPKGKGVT